MTGTQRATETQKSAATSQKNSSNLTTPPFLTSASLHPVLHLQQTIGNQAVLRLLVPRILQAKPGTDARAAEPAVAGNMPSRTLGHDIVFDAGQHALQPSLLHAHILQRKPVFKKCKGREETLSSAIDEAKKLARGALLALKGERLEATEKEHVQTALRNNFGDVTDKQKITITERYVNITDTLDSKEITCINKQKKIKKKAICAEAPIDSNDISIYLHFWKDGCGSKGEMMLHEAAHNAGAKDDVHKDEEYPPKGNAEDNAYSYQFFAVDVHEGPARIRLGSPKGEDK
jgi:hypothetical protein